MDRFDHRQFYGLPLLGGARRDTLVEPNADLCPIRDCDLRGGDGCKCKESSYKFHDRCPLCLGQLLKRVRRGYSAATKVKPKSWATRSNLSRSGGGGAG